MFAYVHTIAGIGTILTLVDESIQPNVGGMVDRGIDVSSSHMMSIIGHPFGIMEYYSGDWSDKGNLLLFMSDLQVNLLGVVERGKL